mgnify:CR=1 FL=1
MPSICPSSSIRPAASSSRCRARPERRLPVAQLVELRDKLKAAHLEVISDSAIKTAYPQLS